MIPQPRRCKDCVKEGIQTLRPTPHPGPRCQTHHRAWRKRSQTLAHGRQIKNGYGITAEQYAALLEAQGGRCAICQVASGKTRRLAVDHDHETGLIRGLLCGPDNLMIGRLRTAGLLRALDYIHNPPSRKVLNP